VFCSVSGWAAIRTDLCGIVALDPGSISKVLQAGLMWSVRRPTVGSVVLAGCAMVDHFTTVDGKCSSAALACRDEHN
jgi:hypothetical protein